MSSARIRLWQRMFAQSRCNEADGAPGSAAEQAPSRCGQLDPGRFMDTFQKQKTH